MENVTSEVSNPFGIRYYGRAVPGYGDANADVHVVGDHPGRHGGEGTGVPFTESVAGVRLQRVLHAVGLLAEPYADRPDCWNCFCSYAHPEVWRIGERADGSLDPDEAAYADAERYLDAELRAVNAHILVLVGDRALGYGLREHTALADRLPTEAAALHAQEVTGRGFLLVPVAEPSGWTPADERALVERLETILDRDYRQTKGVATTVG
ncbi:uracil-DNA glycosylase family protein [Haloglomus litoreum]|uniref:uracil-DNA glycosylase family protein n=1 Tax=Haloglomus litoreum TaxID=3034026 RepID=UPI0023E82D29|nr:uracil-DNA glycosylase family protein [Haloglomus sp. DT116]